MALVLGLLAALAVAFAARGYLLLVSDPFAALVFDDEDDVRDTKLARTGPVTRILSSLDRLVGRRVLGQATEPVLRRADVALSRAGYPEGFTAERLISRQASWAVLGALPGVILLLSGNLLGLALPVAAWFVPRLLVWVAGRKRQAEIDRDLPDFLDVLTVTISAGIGFRPALSRVARATGGPVGAEMMTALRQIEFGATRRRAFEQMRDRNASAALGHFVTAFLQAEELGAPLGEFLTTYAEEMRRASGQRARTAASRANPKISLVITMVIVPAITLFMVGGIVVGNFL
jgi:tight adherence protein C